jgi:hypothetical protein
MSLTVALAGIPGAVVYRANPLTWIVGQRLIAGRVDHLGIANILLKRSAWPEYLQGACEPTALAARLRACVEGAGPRTQAVADAAELTRLLSAASGATPAEWVATYLPRYCQSVSDRTDSDCRGLALAVRELNRDGFWEQLFPDWETCCLALFKRPAAWVEQVVEGVRVLHAQGHNGPISKAQATAAQEHAQQMLAMESPQFAEAGDNQHTLKGGPDNVRTNADTGGNSAAYLAARLKKADRDDLLSEIGPGKRFKSVRAAAIEAGIIHPVPTIRLVPDPVKVAAAIRKHLDQQQIASLVEELQR